MSKGMNKVILIGHLGADPEIRYTQSGTAVANFSLATTEQWKDNEGAKQSSTEWHKIVAWQKLAEIIGEWVHKGDLILIEGKLQTRDWVDKEGIKRYTTEIVANNMLMLGSKGGGQGNHDPNRYPTDHVSEPQTADGQPVDDDIPF